MLSGSLTAFTASQLDKQVFESNVGLLEGDAMGRIHSAYSSLSAKTYSNPLWMTDNQQDMKRNTPKPTIMLSNSQW